MSAIKFEIKRHKHDGVLLNLYGTRDEDECVILRVTAADSEIDISALLPIDELCRMGECADARLERDAIAANEDARVERHLWNREFAIA